MSGAGRIKSIDARDFRYQMSLQLNNNGIQVLSEVAWKKLLPADSGLETKDLIALPPCDLDDARDRVEELTKFARNIFTESGVKVPEGFGSLGDYIQEKKNQQHDEPGSPHESVILANYGITFIPLGGGKEGAEQLYVVCVQPSLCVAATPALAPVPLTADDAPPPPKEERKSLASQARAEGEPLASSRGQVLRSPSVERKNPALQARAEEGRPMATPEERKTPASQPKPVVVASRSERAEGKSMDAQLERFHSDLRAQLSEINFSRSARAGSEEQKLSLFRVALINEILAISEKKPGGLEKAMKIEQALNTVFSNEAITDAQSYKLLLWNFNTEGTPLFEAMHERRKMATMMGFFKKHVNDATDHVIKAFPEAKLAEIEKTRLEKELRREGILHNQEEKKDQPPSPGRGGGPK